MCKRREALQRNSSPCIFLATSFISEKLKTFLMIFGERYRHYICRRMRYEKLRGRFFFSFTVTFIMLEGTELQLQLLESVTNSIFKDYALFFSETFSECPNKARNQDDDEVCKRLEIGRVFRRTEACKPCSLNITRSF